ncbi:hypothetical protein HYH02_011089 [Chlamydomonas schloesseri]|uniref:Uncharacterized protein n=1 Tax=Chlamydomonas schloesseri TaxID=2026947 RepID=A0A835W6T2_9CHLO|nr:hypothetical protein HYH02_011089 [Chlamydomonas schloesseri]|eukprot:KAG2437711.1 hypothetical protein HYH02_011089 [Chlamydomonas schloesseri]
MARVHGAASGGGGAAAAAAGAAPAQQQQQSADGATASQQPHTTTAGVASSKEVANLYKYKYTGCVQEDHREPLFCVAFNTFDLTHRDVFASVGQHRATIYRLLPGGQFEVLQVYEDGDRGRKSSGAGGSGGGADGADGASGAGGAAPGAGVGGPAAAAAAAAATTAAGEHFYCCKWSVDADSGAALLLLAGEKALVRVLDVSRGCLVHTFAGHGKSINDIAVHPARPHLFLTASEDESVRLWNLRSRTCVAIFAGEGGHRNKVLSLDFHPWDGHRFLSSGMDNAIKIWSLGPIERLIDESDGAVDGCVGAGVGATPAAASGPRRAFPTRVVQQPLFSTLRVHNDYVDCVRWMGDLVLSKSVHDVISLWRPHSQAKHRRPPPGGGGSGGGSAGSSHAAGAPPAGASGAGAAGGTGGPGGQEESDEEWDVGVSASGRLGGESVASRATKIADFHLADSLRTWFVRFGADLHFHTLACGSAKGKVFVFAPRVTSAAALGCQPKAKLSAPQCRSVVRQTAVSWDGNSIIAACEDGTIHRWDRDPAAAAAAAAGSAAGAGMEE